MIDPLQLLQNTLKKHQQSVTKSRQLVFTALLDQEPQTMRQLVVTCPTIDRASVYRTIALFEQLGIVQRLQIGWKYKLELTDIFSHHHHHLTCVRCGRVIAFDESYELEQEFQRIADQNNFAMQGHQLEIQGLCSRCKT
jgi:Fur family ferric uptake transcriptional regulator